MPSSGLLWEFDEISITRIVLSCQMHVETAAIEETKKEKGEAGKGQNSPEIANMAGKSPRMLDRGEKATEASMHELLSYRMAKND